MIPFRGLIPRLLGLFGRRPRLEEPALPRPRTHKERKLAKTRRKIAHESRRRNRAS